MTDEYAYDDDHPPDSSELLLDPLPPDMQEYAGLRRVKPLPKRRRMSDDEGVRDVLSIMTNVNGEGTNPIEADGYSTMITSSNPPPQISTSSSLQYLALAAGMRSPPDIDPTSYYQLSPIYPSSSPNSAPTSPHLHPQSGLRSAATVGDLSGAPYPRGFLISPN